MASSCPVFPVIVHFADPSGTSAGGAFHPSKQLGDAALSLAVFTACGGFPAAMTFRSFVVPPAHALFSSELSAMRRNLRTGRGTAFPICRRESTADYQKLSISVSHHPRGTSHG